MIAWQHHLCTISKNMMWMRNNTENNAARLILLFLCTVFSCVHIEFLGANDLVVASDSVRIETDEENLVLIVKKSGDIESILITESTRSTAGMGPSYTYWSTEYNNINGNERRILNTEILDDPMRYYLTDSTAEYDPEFDTVFKILLPRVVNYGFPWTRQGSVGIEDGAFINIRAFSLPFADYRGNYTDNPFNIRVDQVVIEQTDSDATNNFSDNEQTEPDTANNLTDTETVSQLSDNLNFIPGTISELAHIAENTDGIAKVLRDGTSVVDFVEQLVNMTNEEEIDLVIVIDSTRSMGTDISQIKASMPARIQRITDGFKSLRLGLVYYRDYGDAYITTVANTSITDSEHFFTNMQMIVADGGQDQPEAVYEALHSALQLFQWRSRARYILLIADAPPHPKPRGTINEEDVFNLAERHSVQIHTVSLPQ